MITEREDRVFGGDRSALGLKLGPGTEAGPSDCDIFGVSYRPTPVRLHSRAALNQPCKAKEPGHEPE
jgi:hypothetical protein